MWDDDNVHARARYKKFKVRLVILRGHPFMASALGGGLKNWLILRTNSTDKVREMQTNGEGGF